MNISLLEKSLLKEVGALFFSTLGGPNPVPAGSPGVWFDGTITWLVLPDGSQAPMGGGSGWWLPARAATTAALAANTYANGTNGVGATLTANANGALAAQDGVSLAVGDRLLVLFEATAANNGMYVVTALGGASAPYVLTRAADASTPAQLAGAEFVVTKGAMHTGSTYFLPLDKSSITVGTTALSLLRVAAGLIHQVIAYSATPAFTLAESQQITMTGNITGWTLPAGVGDMEVAISFIQDGTGSRTLAGAGANIRLAGGSLTLSTGPNKIDTVTLKWNANLVSPAWVEKSRVMGS